MKISNTKCHQTSLKQIFYIDCEKLHQAKVDMGAVSKESCVEESLYSDLGELDMILKNTIKDYFADYGKDIFLEEQD